MPIDVTCPDCFQEYSVKESLAGKKIRCKECQGIIKVPADAAGVDDLEDLFDEAPTSTKSKPGSAKTSKSGKRTGGKQATASRGGWSEVPWIGAGIPLGIAIVLFTLSRLLPFGPAVMIVMLLTMLVTLGCGLAGFYMLARVSSRMSGDLQLGHLRTAKKVGGGEAVVALASIGFLVVVTKALFQAPRKTVPWFLMMVLGIGGLVWTVKNDRDAFKPGAFRNQNSSMSDAEWERIKADVSRGPSGMHAPPRAP